MKGVRTKQQTWALRIAAAAWLSASSAHAQTAGEQAADSSARDVAAAAQVFQEAQKAQLTGELARAAQMFELADVLAPAPEALRSAIRNHDAAAHPARAATLALAALDRYPDDADTREIAQQTLDRLGPQLARLSVTCDRPCALLLDGDAVAAQPVESADVYLSPGPHRIAARFDAERATAQTLELLAGEHEQLALVAPEPAVRAPIAEPVERLPPVREVASTRSHTDEAPARAGLSPWLAAGAGALTVGCATAALVVGLDTVRKRDAYEAEPTRARYESGVESQKWSNALWIATGGLAVTSLVLAAFTDWDGESQRSTATLSLSPLAANLTVRSSLP
jgi:hypothetical protein